MELKPIQITAIPAPSPDEADRLFALCEDLEGRRSIWYRPLPAKAGYGWERLPPIIDKRDQFLVRRVEVSGERGIATVKECGCRVTF